MDINGLIYQPDFLSTEEEISLVEQIDQNPWLSDLKRRVQHYGWKYDYTKKSIDNSMLLGPLPDWLNIIGQKLVAQKLINNFPDQVIINEYIKGQGISRHVDCVPCFMDGIATISLIESWEMIFRNKELSVGKILERRSVTVLTQDARFNWSHEIPTRVLEPTMELPRGRRISVTFRKVRTT